MRTRPRRATASRGLRRGAGWSCRPVSLVGSTNARRHRRRRVSGWRSSSESTSATTRIGVPAGSDSMIAATAGRPVSSATSRYQSVPAGGSNAAARPPQGDGVARSGADGPRRGRSDVPSRRRGARTACPARRPRAATAGPCSRHRSAARPGGIVAYCSHVKLASIVSSVGPGGGASTYRNWSAAAGTNVVAGRLRRT